MWGFARSMYHSLKKCASQCSKTNRVIQMPGDSDASSLLYTAINPFLVQVFEELPTLSSYTKKRFYLEEVKKIDTTYTKFKFKKTSTLSPHTIILHGCPNLSPHTIILHGCPNLSPHTIILHGCPNLSPHTMILHGCLNLLPHTIILHGCPNLSPRTGCPNLSTLDIIPRDPFLSVYMDYLVTL